MSRRARRRPASTPHLLRAPIQTNDEILGATLVSAWPYGSTEDTRTATSNVSDPVHSCGTRGRDSNTVWFRFVSTFNGTVWVSTVNSNYDTVLSAYAGTSSVGPQLACNDDSNGTMQSDISFSVSSGQSYLIEVSAYGATSAGGTLILTVAPAAAPVVTTQPQNQTITSGQGASLSVVATGTAPLAYQWYREQWQHGQPDCRRDLEQLHDARAHEHGHLLGASQQCPGHRQLQHRHGERWQHRVAGDRDRGRAGRGGRLGEPHAGFHGDAQSRQRLDGHGRLRDLRRDGDAPDRTTRRSRGRFPSRRGDDEDGQRARFSGIHKPSPTSRSC